VVLKGAIESQRVVSSVMKTIEGEPPKGGPTPQERTVVVSRDLEHEIMLARRNGELHPTFSPRLNLELERRLVSDDDREDSWFARTIFEGERCR